MRRRARLYELVPVKELQKRGWISSTEDIDGIEQDVLTFLGITSLDEEPSIVAALRKTAPDADLTAIDS